MDEMTSQELNQFLEAIAELIESKATTVQEAAEIVRNKKIKPLAEADDDDYCIVIATTICIVIAIIATVVICVQVADIIKALAIPEITIYKFAKPFLKGGC